jgi:hypothetical protein
MSASIKQEIIKQLDKLPLELQRRVLDFAHALVMSTPRGMSGKDLLRFAGIIDEEDLKAMEKAIEEGCERIDEDKAVKPLDIEEIFDIICQHFITKKEYFKLFGDHILAMKGWINGEVVWLLHQPNMKEHGLFVASRRGIEPGTKSRRPDLQLKISNQDIFVELKALPIVTTTRKWDYVLARSLVAEFNSLLLKKSDWFVSFTYSLENRCIWEHIVKQAIDNKSVKQTADKVGLSVYCVKDIDFDIGDNQKCLISLFGLQQP